MTAEPINDPVAAPLLEVQSLTKHFGVPRKKPWGERDVIRAVDGLSFVIPPHETLGLVGESGCGKTTTARMLLRLEVPTSGEVLYKGKQRPRTSGVTLSGPTAKRYRPSSRIRGAR